MGRGAERHRAEIRQSFSAILGESLLLRYLQEVEDYIQWGKWSTVEDIYCNLKVFSDIRAKLNPANVEQCYNLLANSIPYLIEFIQVSMQQQDVGKQQIRRTKSAPRWRPLNPREAQSSGSIVAMNRSDA